MKSIAIFLAIFAVGAFGASVSNEVRLNRKFEAFKAVHQKVYATEVEHELRRKIFHNNVKFMEEHNAEYKQGLQTYEVGVNHFADLTNDEFVSQHLSPLTTDQMTSSDAEIFDHTAVTDAPDAMDWREKGYVTRVKNQGQCGSCWAFSAVAAIEGANFKKNGTLVELSEQDLVDCDKQSSGCNGGLMGTAFNQVISDKGIDTEASYPYEGVQKECRFNKENVGATISSYKRIESGNEDAVKAATADIGPIAVAIDASPIGFQFYKRGVFSSWMCSSSRLNHGVTLVGYGQTTSSFWGKKDFWTIKNSWGKMWGNHGYINIARNKNNMCGVATQASYPIA